jgi:two-component system heavy metal sensor histidine kinase CusS
MGEAGAPDLKPAGARTARPWSLARRLTTLFLVSTSLFVVAISATSALFLERAVDKEVQNLTQEKLDSMGRFLDEPMPKNRNAERIEEAEPDWRKPEDIQAQVQHLAEQHQDYHFAWCIWQPSNETSLPYMGENWVADGVPASWELRPFAKLGQGRFWQSEQTQGGWRMLLVLDARARYGLLRQHLAYALVLILASLCVSLVFSRVFFVRVSELLGQVARRAREVRSLDEPLGIEVEHAPIEIAGIADALSEMLDKVRRETEQARIFTAGLAHELRSPVQNLVGETEVALLRERDAETYRKVLASHLEELRSLGDAIDNLVTICSAGDAGRSRPRELIDLGEEAKIRLARERAAGARHQVQLELGIEGDTRLWGDREALLRAIRNLVANAIQWSPPNTKVVARVRGQPQAVEVLVEDAGPGIAPELRQRIFEPFFRGPQAAGRRIGYGLGLALTRMAVDEHSGTIEVSDSLLGGARFRMLLPRRAPESESNADSSTHLTS